MSAEQRYKRWLLIVREHLVEQRIVFDPSFDWRSQFDDGQTPTAAVDAFRASHK